MFKNQSFLTICNTFQSLDTQAVVFTKVCKEVIAKRSKTWESLSTLRQKSFYTLQSFA